MEFTNLTNHFLIAMPALADPNFFHTVTFVCAHNQEGAMGIIVNRPLDLHLGEILAQMNIHTTATTPNEIRIYDGGPVQRERGFVIHWPKGDWDAMLPVGDELGVTTSRDVLAAVANDEGPKNSLIALGYAGWGAGQLEKEMAENAWLSGPADMRILFETPSEQRWEAAAGLLGVDFDRLSSQAGHA
ncbi:MAG: YqgE/AlgH family protein [Gammaproteobacteria bacterium]|nr:YqgE/AlgH family protein [Gammaproteobacteria bacterium]